MNTITENQHTKQAIAELLDDLSSDSLKLVEQFVRLLNARKVYREDCQYPTVSTPASSLNAWSNLLRDGCGGDALADTEALYDEV